MALRQLNSYSLVGNDDLDALMETEDKNFKGKCSASLTEYDTTAKPKLAAGSVIEVNGALFIADDDEDPSGSPTDGTVYLKIVPSESTATVELTATTPAWDNEKQGWYSPTAGEENHRYVGGCTKTGASYTSKFLLLILNSIGLKAYKDRISFTFLDDMEIGELIIGDLKMYGFGDVELYSINNSTTIEFYILKPVRVMYTPEANNCAIYQWRGGAYSLNVIENNNSRFFDLPPGRYKHVTGGSGQPHKLIAISVTGASVLTKDAVFLQI